MKIFYDIAQVCTNGHLTNPAVECIPENNKNFCPDCGSKTITKCSNCDTPLQGLPKLGSKVYGKFENVPSYCTSCGSPYPWTLAIQQTAYEIISFAETLSSLDQEQLRTTIPDLITDTPKTSLAVLKFKKYTMKAGKEIAIGLKDVLIDIVSETVKKAIWGNG